MRINEPVTGQELDFPADTMLVSRTDLAGKITFVNKAFIAISGYSEQELLGAPHNLVRHPDMPPAAFADLWNTLKAGQPWQGLVKNRAKSGDHYWVRANAMPYQQDGETVGYISIRTKPTREEVSQAEAIYARFRNGTAGSLRVEAGRVVAPPSLLQRLTGSVKAQLTVIFGVLMALMIGIGVTALSGMRNSNESLRTVYEDRTVPTGQLGDVASRMRENLGHLSDMGLELSQGQNNRIPTHVYAMRNNIKAITQTWDAYMATYLTPEEKILADRFAIERGRFVKDGLEPAIALAEAGKPAELADHLLKNVAPLFAVANGTHGELIQLQMDVARSEYESASAAFDRRVAISVAGMVGALVIGLLLARFLLKTVSEPLARMQDSFGAIAVGNFGHRIADEAVLDFKLAASMLQTMQVQLGYSIQEKAELDRQAEERRRADMNALADSMERRVKTVVQGIGSSSAQLSASARALSENATNTMTQSSFVSEQTEQVTNNVQAVSAATHELTCSVDEISRQVAHAADIAQNAVHQAEDTNAMVQRLAEAASRIGQVVGLINTIASQTNLLALNATIEAARAGEAGKGFAVVANEVKSLANQTSKATQEITHQITGIQEETHSAVAAIQDITRTIGNINELSSAIAAAVEEQGAATGEIARSVEQAAAGTASAATGVGIVAEAAQSTGSMAEQVSAAAQSLKGDADSLDREVANFLHEVRSA